MAMFLPGLGDFGLWEPWERTLADRAAALERGAQAGAERPGLALLLPALGMQLLGVSEQAARLPGALLAVATLLAVAWAGWSLFSRAAGNIAALVLVGTPLFVLQGRQLTSDMALLLASALALGGLGRLARAEGPRARGVSIAAAAAGLGLAALAGGVLVGVVVPALAFGAAWLLGGARSASPPFRRLAPVVALVGVALVLITLMTPYRAGQSSWLLGGTPVFGPSSRSFEAAFRLLGFGLFPWSALALFAVLSPLAALDEDPPPEARSRAFGVLLLVFSVVFGLAAATLQLHLVGQAKLAVLPALALLLGRWLGDPEAAPPVNRVLGLVVATGTLILTRDLWLSPEELFSVHLPAKITWPPGLSVRPWVLALGLVFAAALLARLLWPAGDPGPGRLPRLASRARRWAVPTLLLSAATFSLGIVLLVIPLLSRHFSQKRLHDTYRAMGGGGLALYRMPREGSGAFGQPPSGETTATSSAAELAERLRADPAQFALIPRTELPAVDEALADAGVPYAVADASSSRYLLLAARLPPGASDQNPLSEHRFRPRGAVSPPWDPPGRPIVARYDDAVELYGADFPASVRRPGSFPLTLYFRTLRRPPPGYKIFVHVEQPGARLHGDHPPLGGTLPIERWRPGDLLRDTHRVPVPLVTAPAGLYTIYVGFWPGGDTVRRLPVTAGLAHDGRDRVALGTIQVR
jgi:4-amino-4-deoxy-L-arabinose transferase-like glycosyltransferase